MANTLHFDVVPESLQERGGMLHGIVGYYNGKPVPFLYDPTAQDIITPESLEPIYPAIEEAVVRYLRAAGKMQ